jgi:hypothetical protein
MYHNLGSRAKGAFVSGFLGPDLYRNYCEIASVLIPGGRNRPSAGEVDRNGIWLDRALRARPELVEWLRRVLAEAERLGETGGILSWLTNERTSDFEQLNNLVACVYYMNPKVGKRLGYLVHQRRPIAEDEAGLFLEDGILEPVMERGRLWRSVAVR